MNAMRDFYFFKFQIQMASLAAPSTTVEHTKVSPFRNVTKRRQHAAGKRRAGAAMGKGGHVTHVEDV